MKRILIFSLTYAPFESGAEIAVREITDRLDSREWEFDLLTLRFDRRLPKQERVGNVNVYRLGFSKRGAAITDTFRFPLFLNKYWSPFASAARAYWLHRRHHYNAVWAIMANYASFGALFFGLMRPEVPFVLTLQEGDPVEHIMRRVGVLRPLFRKIFMSATVVQAISRFLGRFAMEMGAEPASIVVIPNGVDTKRFISRSVEGLQLMPNVPEKKPDEVFLITTSRLVEKNAVDVIIKAMRFLPPTVKLLIAGAGPLEAKLRLRTTNYKLQNQVFFLGNTTHVRLPDLLARADVFVRPSRSEGQGISFIEAMAAGVPIVATPVGGIPDFLTDRETGVMCEVDNPESVAESVALLIRDSALREHIAVCARELVVERYDWNHLTQRMEAEVFRRVVQ